MKTSPSAKMPTEILREERHFIQKVVRAMAVLAERLEQAETVDAEKLQRVVDFMRTFAENGP
jgi:hemerythrin-like domain-containing protein